jgi:dTDP-glucose pyrophosphorylase
MTDWTKTLVTPETSIRDTIGKINDSALQIALVVDSGKVLLGTVTDGDIRAGILKGVSLDAAVQTIMHRQPSVARPGEDRESILSMMKVKRIHHIPVVDREGRLIGLETLDALIKPAPRDNIVVLMAGGLGTRLRPLTDERPKPLLSIGNRPILETIILNFIEYGLSRFYIAVNYKAEMVIDHFGDGSRWDVSISYLHEKQRMGTAGALGLLPEKPSQTLLVMNADLLTKVNFANLLTYHAKHNAKATMCVREYDFQVPYGVVNLDDHRLVSIEEKPVKRFFVNAGIYAMEPDVLDLVPQDTFFDMPQLFEQLVKRKKHEAAVFPIREYWMDIGQMNDFERATNEYHGEF